jgi:hypothetical protein
MRPGLVCSVVLVLAGLSGCHKKQPPQQQQPQPNAQAPASPDGAALLVDASIPPPLPTLLGAWRGRPGTAFTGLVLQSPEARNELRYYLYRRTECADAGTCTPTLETGSYAQTETALTLTPSQGGAQSLTFTLAGDALTLTLPTGGTALLDRVPNFCEVPSDCARDVAIRASLQCPQGEWQCTRDHMCISHCTNGNGALPDFDAGNARSAPPADGGSEPPPVAPTGRVSCGDVQCPEGQVCCNPLRSICTPPGMACIQ